MVSQNPYLLPKTLLKEIGVLLKQARTARQLSLATAAYELKIELHILEKIEMGRIQFSGFVAQKIAHFYGVHETRINSILFDWAMLEMHKKSMCEHHRHLSLLGPTSKPRDENCS
jgi:predicted transcriptional regulator